ncbi:MAG: aldo/keto reductase, partial [Nitrospirota bacterium]
MMADFRKHTILGRTGLSVSRLGIGSGYGVPAVAVEKAFHEYGVNYFFWSSPRRRGLRDAVRSLSPAARDKMVIAIQTYDHHGFLMRRFVEKGLRELHIDYADVLILGWFNNVPGSRVLDAALKLKEEGRVRFIGMSGHNRPVFGQMAVQPGSPVDIFMIRYNAVHRGAEKDIFPFL